MLPLSNIKYITIHYSATWPEKTVTVDDIDSWHRERGFRTAGYHAFGPRAGTRYIDHSIDNRLRYFGPDGFEEGAHSKRENKISVGYCFEGGGVGVDLDGDMIGGDTRTPAQTRAMIQWIDSVLALTGGDGVDPAKGPGVVGHRDMPGA